MVPIVIDVAVTPVSNAVLPLPPLPPPPPDPPPRLVPPGPADGPESGSPPPGPTPAPPGPVLPPGTGSPDGPVSCGPPACCCAWTKAVSGNRVPQAASTRLPAASAHSAGLDRIAGFSPFPSARPSAAAELHPVEQVVELLHPEANDEPDGRVRRPDEPPPVGGDRLATACPRVVPRHLAGERPQQLTARRLDGVDARRPRRCALPPRPAGAAGRGSRPVRHGPPGARGSRQS